MQAYNLQLYKGTELILSYSSRWLTIPECTMGTIRPGGAGGAGGEGWLTMVESGAMVVNIFLFWAMVVNIFLFWARPSPSFW